jgi:3-methylcrotonyl-CoA carboxylase alpha subunit
MFNRVLIANRGEIACRIIRAAKSLGIITVAIYSDADRYAKHVKLADQAFYLGASDVLVSYLNQEKIIAIAKRANAQAIHPGYGLLSENAEFAKACETAGLCFIGPRSQTIADLADKAKAKVLAASLSIPVLESLEVPEMIDDAWINALDLRTSWMIKACSGGGGKGMRLIDKNSKNIKTTLELAKKEAQHYFNHDAIILERYIPTARHIEVQILADHYGKVVHLFDRDCSLQRRYQKVIEIAPACGIDQSVKEAMYLAAIRLAQSVNYVNAGTVEFLLDEDNHFYFLEMNTRIQVEHCVTEMIMHQDIVQRQFEIAAGLPIIEDQSDFQIDGVAIEVRLCAEMPEKNFMPSVGLFKQLRWPDLPYVRIDSGYEKGDVITPYYDSLFAKMIVHGKDRNEAVRRLQEAMNTLVIEGIETNQDWILNIIYEDIFLTGRLFTHFLDQYHPEKKNSFPSWVAPALIRLSQRFSFSTEQEHNPWYHNTRLSNATDSSQVIFYLEQSKKIAFRIVEKSEKNFEISHDLKTLGNLMIHSWGVDEISFLWDGQIIKAYIATRKHSLSIRIQDAVFYYHAYPMNDSAVNETHSGELCAQLPGSVVKVLVRKGDPVQKGDRLLVMEAMKMEHALLAPFSGVVEKIETKEGERVFLGQLLVILKSTST